MEGNPDCRAVLRANASRTVFEQNQTITANLHLH